MIKFTFVHIPKTGGTSLRKFFKQRGIRIINHAIRDKGFRYLKEIPKENSEIRFCYVRNPYDRVVSAFFYLSKGGINRGDYEDALRFNIIKYQENFELFVKNEFYENSPIFEQMHFKEQYKWICDNNGNILVDKILRFEEFGNEILSFLKENNLKVPFMWRLGRVPHKNKSKKSNYKTYYNEETKNIIAKAYKTDFKLFHYSTEEL